MDFQALRKEYEHDGIGPGDFGDEPIAEFRKWLDAAVDAQPVDWFEPNAIVLATADGEGRPSVRWVLLKGITDRGIKFYTNYGSTKGQQIAANARGAIAVHWPYLGRQVRIEGSLVRTSRQDSVDYFHSRPRGSQIGAAVSPQSAEIGSREELETARRELETHIGDGEIPCPENWGGFELIADQVEFWQGKLNRLHDRVQFEKQDCGWLKKRLAP